MLDLVEVCVRNRICEGKFTGHDPLGIEISPENGNVSARFGPLDFNALGLGEKDATFASSIDRPGDLASPTESTEMDSAGIRFNSMGLADGCAHVITASLCITSHRDVASGAQASFAGSVCVTGPGVSISQAPEGRSHGRTLVRSPRAGLQLRSTSKAGRAIVGNRIVIPSVRRMNGDTAGTGRLHPSRRPLDQSRIRAAGTAIASRQDRSPAKLDYGGLRRRIDRRLIAFKVIDGCHR
jgi:hypothetical protein